MIAPYTTLFRSLASTDCRPAALRRRASRPQLKRDPLGGVQHSRGTMIGSDFQDLFVLFVVFGGGLWVLAPLARAFAKRISATTPPVGQAPVLDELTHEPRRL